MKKIFSLMAVLFAFQLVAFCQPGARGMRGDQQMLEQLNLSEEQKSKMEAINEDFRNKMKELQNDNSLSESEMSDRKRAIFMARRKQMMELLTPEQIAQFEASVPERGNRFDPEEFRTALSLTDEQYVKLKELISSSREKEKSILRSNEMTPEQRKQYMEAMNKNNLEVLRTLLSPEQTIKLNELLAKKTSDKEKAKPTGKN